MSLEPNRTGQGEIIGRPVKEDEIEILVPLILRSFGFEGPGTGIRHFFAHKAPDFADRRVLIERTPSGDRLIGAILHFRFHGHYCSQNLECSGLGWVCIDPDYQGRGLGLQLLEDSIVYLEALGTDLCFLYTGSAPFYRHRGWESVFHQQNFMIATKDFPNISLNKPDKSLVIRPVEQADLPKIQEIYEPFNMEVPFSLVRDLAYWERTLALLPPDQDSILSILNHDQIVGYCRLEYGGKDGKHRLVVLEYAIDPRLPPAYQEELGTDLLFQLQSRAEARGYSEIGLRLPRSLSLVHQLLGLGGKDVTGLLCSLMVRIINLPGFLAKHARYINEVVIPQLSSSEINALPDQALVLRVENSFLEIEKRGTIIQARIIPESEGEILELTRQEFALVALGHFSVPELVEYELWECPTQYLLLLSACFPNIRGYIYPFDGF